MKKFRKYLMAASLLCLGSSVQAQGNEFTNGKDYKPYPHMFVTLQGGGQLTVTNYDHTKLITPVGAVSFGGYFAPAIGARLSVLGFQSKGGFDALDKTYKFNFITTNADLLINLTNLFGQAKSRLFNVVLLGGVGLSYAWDNDKVHELIAQKRTLGTSAVWKDNLLSHNFRVGVQFDFNVSKHWNVMLEIDGNNLSDKFNSKRNGRNDWQATALVGVSYKFGFRKQPIPEVVEIIETEVIVPVQPQPVVTPPAPVVEKVTPLKTDIFFNLASAVILEKEQSKITEMVAWLKKYPKTKVSITGYADKDTGTSKINQMYSQERAESVKNALIKAGISADRITTAAKGSTVQPFSVNNENRVAICIGEE